MTNSRFKQFESSVSNIPLDKRAKSLRRTIVRMLEHSRRGHLSPALSLVEIFRVLYDDVLKYNPANPKWAERDRCILSKGHGCLALYAILAEKKFFPGRVANSRPFSEIADKFWDLHGQYLRSDNWKWMLDKIGNTVLSDMITLEFMRLKSGFSAGDTSGIIDGTTFDHNFTISQQTFSSYLEHDRGYQMPEWQMAPDGLSKAIVWRDRKPFGRLLGNEVRFVAIHCSGSAKALIPNLYRA